TVELEVAIVDLQKAIALTDDRLMHALEARARDRARVGDAPHRGALGLSSLDGVTGPRGQHMPGGAPEADSLRGGLSVCSASAATSLGSCGVGVLAGSPGAAVDASFEGVAAASLGGGGAFSAGEPAGAPAVAGGGAVFASALGEVAGAMEGGPATTWFRGTTRS